MPILIVDGPEAAGKTTLIEGVLDLWPYNVGRRSWGPVGSWHEYTQPLKTDLEMAQSPHFLAVWDRSWASEFVYDALMNRRRYVPLSILKARFEDRVPRLKLMLVPQAIVLEGRRSKRGITDDLPVDPYAETQMFKLYAHTFGWLCGDWADPRAVFDLVKGSTVR